MEHDVTSREGRSAVGDGVFPASESRVDVISNEAAECVSGYNPGQGVVRAVAAPGHLCADNTERGAAPRTRACPRPVRDSSKSGEGRRSHVMEERIEQSSSHDHLTNHTGPATAAPPGSTNTSICLTGRPPPASLAFNHADAGSRFCTVPVPRAGSAKIPKTHGRQRPKHAPASWKVDSAGREQNQAASSQCRKEEVRRLARSMASSIENLIDNLHGIVGDLRQLVLQIDTVTDCIDASCGMAALHQQQLGANGPQHACNTFTQTEQVPLPSHDVVRRAGTREQRRSTSTKASYRFSYPQCSRDAILVSNLSSPSSSDASSRKVHRRSKLSKKTRDGAYHAYQRPARSAASSQDHTRTGNGEAGVEAFVRQVQPHVVRRRHRVPGIVNGATSPVDAHGSVAFVSKAGASISRFPAESPPNPAPALFWAYREEEEAEKSDHAKDSDSLPDTGLKNWREMMEMHGGSADSLTPQMDWSYLALTDHSPNAITAGFRLRKPDHRADSSPGPAGHHGRVSSPRTECPVRPHKDWPKLSLSGLKSKLRIGGIHGIPENSEPCDSSCSENGDVFVQTEPPDSAVLSCRLGTEHAASQHSPGCESRTSLAAASPQGRTTFPRVQQSVGGAALGWSTCSKALPGWPSEDLSSIGASDSDMDDLSSPSMQRHFQYPRTSSAGDSFPEKKAGLASPPAGSRPPTMVAATEVVQARTMDSSISGDTIASGGFEVRAEVDTSPESDVTSCYGGQYEVVMETKLEQLSGNEAEGSDFSDADADVGSDVLEQSLTSLEEVASAVKYDREVNTWTSYTMTHIDSDDVVSDCTSDILNENVFDMATTNPGFDDVSLYFEDVGFPALSIHTCKIDQMNTSLE